MTAPRPAARSPRSRSGDQLMAIVVMLAALAAAPFIGIFSQEFTAWDDEEYVTGNPIVMRGLTPAGIKWAFTTDHASNYHPFTWLSLMADVTVFGPSAPAMKTVNLLLHVANALLLFLFFSLTTKRLLPSFFVAALFAVHPLHVESVVWIAERKDLLSTFFALLAMNAYAWYAIRGPRWIYIFVVMAFLASLLSKQMYVTLPLLFLLLDDWPLTRLGGPNISDANVPVQPRTSSPVALLTEKLPLLLVSLAASLVIIAIQRANPNILAADLTFTQKIMNAITSYGVYLRQMVWPMDLAYFYPIPEGGPSIVSAGISLVVLVTITGVTLLFRQSAPFLFVGWLWYVLSLLPVIGIIQVGFQAHADRYTYFPLVGIFVMIVFSVASILESKMLSTMGTSLQRSLVASVAGLVVLAACVFLSYRQVGYWENTETLARRGAEIAPDGFYPQLHLGKLALLRGQWDAAQANLESAVQKNPSLVPGLMALSDLALANGDVDKSLDYVRRAKEIAPGNFVVRYSQGLILLGQRKTDEAIAELTEAVKINPGVLGVRTALAVANAQQGNYREALRLLQRVKDFNHETRSAYELVSKMQQGDRPAEGRFRRQFSWPPTVNGSKLRTIVADQHERAGRYAEAAAELEVALKLWPNNVDAMFRMANLKFKSGDFRGGEQLVNQAVLLSPFHPDAQTMKDLVARAREELRKASGGDPATPDPILPPRP